jgi:transglutaminase-like putative cysteine protease
MIAPRVAPEARGRLLVIAIFAAATLIVAGNTPPWSASVALGCAVWRFMVTWWAVPAPRPRKGYRFLFGAATALMVGGVLLNFRTLNGLSAGTALLVVMGALKLVEARARRDDGIVIGVSLFMLLAAALADQSLSRLPLYLLVVWGACAAMMQVAHPHSGLPLRSALRLSARALLMAAPLAAACFVFFPRFSSQFWALPGGGGASTGLSDEMSPGAIDKLVGDYEPAFRVRFEGPPPPPQFRYWRGPVLNSFDGFTWRRERRLYVDTPRELLGEAVRYRVTLEPTQQNWIFALDTVDGSPRHNMVMAQDRQLSRNEPVTEALTYDASSHLQTRATGPLSSLGRRYETQLPASRNPRTLTLARDLRARAPDDAAYSRLVLEWFRDHGLEYTLQPEPTSVESVDSVLFDTKQGFCGHFASAYATMMRAAGIPARVVTGYLGGEWNPIGGYLIVRQSDAHAWTEIWLDGRGWTRVDPTAVVEPERLLRGAYDVMGEASTPMTISLLQNSWVARFAQYWDGANTWWRERVVEFNLRSQLDLLGKLGIDAPNWRHLGWAFGAALLGWLIWVTATLRRSVAREKPDRIARAWLAATRKLEKVAAPRAPHEGALTYARRISAQHPHLADGITAVATRYVRLRYGPEAANEDITALEREVRQLAV